MEVLVFCLSLQVKAGPTVIIPETTIPIDTLLCSTNSTHPLDMCFPLVTASTEVRPGPASPTPPSIPTCLALQQVADHISLGTAWSNCVIADRCSRLSCTYLGLYPFSLSLLPCNTPPAVEFTIYNSTGSSRSILVNEKLLRTRNVPLDQLEPGTALYVVVNHPCGRSAIILEVSPPCF